jgi:hypothetical protein
MNQSINPVLEKVKSFLGYLLPSIITAFLFFLLFLIVSNDVPSGHAGAICDTDSNCSRYGGDGGPHKNWWTR